MIYYKIYINAMQWKKNTKVFSEWKKESQIFLSLMKFFYICIAFYTYTEYGIESVYGEE